MRGKSMVLILIALGCGLVASIGISQILDRQGTAPKIETKKIYVAAIDVDIHDRIDAEMIKLEEWPADKVPEDAMSDLEGIKGLAPRQRLFAGEPIRRNKLLDPEKEGSTARRIPKGLRVQAIKVDAASAVANLIEPGDHVDVLVYLRKGGNIAETTTKTILQDVRVFAVNHKTNRVTDEEGNVINARTVSLLLTPEQVERILMASRLGSINLSLRSPEDNEESLTDGVTPGEFLLGNAEDATPDDPEPVQQETQSKSAAVDFQDFLDSITADEPEVEAEPVSKGWEIVMMTPDSVTTFEVQDDAKISKARMVTDTPPVEPQVAADPAPLPTDLQPPTNPVSPGDDASSDDQSDEPDADDDADSDPDA